MLAPTTRRKLHWKKRWQLPFAQKTLSEMFWKKTNFETEHLSQPFDNKSWY